MSSSSDPQCTPAQPPPPDPPHQPPPLDPPHQPLHQPPQQSAASAALAAPVTGAAEPRPQSPALAASFIADVEPRPQSPARPPPHHQTLQQPPPLLPDPPPLLPQPMQEPPPLQQQPPPPLQQQEPVVAAQPLQQQPPPPLQQQPPPPTMVATPLQQQPPPPLQQQQPRLQWQPPPPQHQPPPQPPPPQQPPDRLSLLRRPGSSSGFFGVTKERKGSAARPYLAQIQRDGRKLGRFSTALEAAHASVDAMTDEDATRLGAAPPLRDDGLSVEAAAEAAEARAHTGSVDGGKASGNPGRGDDARMSAALARAGKTAEGWNQELSDRLAAVRQVDEESGGVSYDWTQLEGAVLVTTRALYGQMTRSLTKPHRVPGGRDARKLGVVKMQLAVQMHVEGSSAAAIAAALSGD